MSTASPYDEFWNWFRSNGTRLRDMLYSEDADARQEAMDELSSAVGEVAPEVLLELCQGGEGKPDQLVASADGKSERVDAVKEFVASAPAVPGWEVVAFRPRMDIGDALEIAIEGERIAPADVWCRVEDDRGGLGLTLYVRGLTEANRRFRGLGASLLAEHTMGERDAVTLLNSLQIEPLPDDPAGAGLRPLPELVAVVDEAREQRFPPPGSLPLPPEGEWQGLRGEINDTPAMILLNTGVQPFAGHPQYDRRLSVSIAFNETDEHGMPATEEEFHAASELGDQIAEALDAIQESVLTLMITNQGRRELIFYTSNADAALKRLAPWLTDKQTHAIEASVEYDTFWGAYLSFCDAAEESDEDEPEE